MRNLIKLNEQQDRIKQYEFFEATSDYPKFDLDKTKNDEKDKNVIKENKLDEQKSEDVKSEETKESKEKKKEVNKQQEDFDKIAQTIIDDAKKQADEMLEKAKLDAEKIKEEAFEEGHKNGYEIGFNEVKEDVYKELRGKEEQKTLEYLNELKEVINDLSLEKDKILANYKLNLIDIAISVAEKIVQVSLKTSGEIIERMILSATERLASKEWVKIYISRTDAELMIEGGIDIIQALSNLSDNIKVIPMENEGQGTCIIEFPDEIIDASASTQVENIRDIISNSAV